MIASSENDLGVVDSGTVLDEVLFEMLEHQGVLYEKVNEKERKTYPVVLIATGDADAVVKGRKNCSSSEGVVVVDRSIDLKHVLRCLAGLEVQKEDRFKFVVNEFEVKLMAMVKDALSATNSPLTRKGFWPGNAPACCVMTSDVDWLTYSPFHKAVAKGRLSPRRLARLIYGSLSGKNYGLNFDSMVKAQKKHNYKSTVFLRSSYEKGGENLAGGVGLLKEAGFEIALHGSDGAHSSLDTLSSQMEDIASIAGARPKGVRQHILKMDIPKTWEIESNAGLDYDATFAYNRFFGFRGEICFPYHPFSTKRLPLIELPTSFMDWTALYKGVRGSQAERVLNSIMERVEHYNGLLLVNFHNTYLNRETFPDVLALYEGLIDRIFERGYWVTTASACSEWWRRRASEKPRVGPEWGKAGENGDVQLEVIDRIEPSIAKGVRN